MLREEQIDIRRRRAREGQFTIENTGKNRVFSDFRVTNPATGGVYTVGIRGFEVGNNTCTCPDFKSNTLLTCKHIEAVLAHLEDEVPGHLRQRKAAVTRPEVFLSYGEQLRLGLHLPARHSDALGELARRFFDADGFLKPDCDTGELTAAIQRVPEQVTVLSDAMEFIERETDRRDLAAREREWAAALDRGETPAELRDLLRRPPYDYQLRGAAFIAGRGRCILADDMGLGKSVQTMAGVEVLARVRGVSKVLVVAPASVKYQWQAEIEKFTDRRVQVIDGLQDDRKRQYAEPTFYRLVNYEQIVRDLDAFNQWQPDLIVLDEAQRIKNWESKTSRSVKKLRSRYALVLTGTPLENKLEELYSIVQFVDDRRLGPAFQFLHDHRILDDKGNLQGYRNLDAIRGRLEPILLRRTRSEVLTQLPARTDQTKYVELADAQRGPYEEQRGVLARLVQKTHLTELDRRRILACVVNLRLICNSLALFDKQTDASPKLDEFGELAQELAAAGGHKAVVFSQWETMLEKARGVLDRVGVGSVLLHGKVPGRERAALVERFRTDPDCRVFLSTDAGGTGLNLQAADTVVNLEVPWNPAVLEQRIARAHRMGQERPVRVVNLVTRGSIEERVLRALEQKKGLFAGLFEGDEDEIGFEAAGRSLFLDTVRELLRPDEPPPAAVPAAAEEKTADARLTLAAAGVQLLEALAACAAGGHLAGLPEDALLRGRAALEALGRAFAAGEEGPS